MIRTPSIILLAFMAGRACAAPADWAYADAPWRVALHADGQPGAPEAGWEIDLPDFGGGRPDMRDVVLLGSDGREIALDGIWRGSGRKLLMLAESMPATGDAMLYFGGDAARRTRSWSGARSLLLETRRMPAGSDITTFAGWQDAWRKSPAVDGVEFVPMIFHGGNPFGPESAYLSRYTGLVRTGDGGEMKFYTLSDDVSYVLMDGRAVMSWQKNQPPPLDPKQVPTAKVRLNPGMAKVEYCHGAVDAPGAMVLGWEKDGKLGNMPPEAWIHPGKVKAGAFESADGSPVPLINLQADSYVGFGGEWYVDISATIPDPAKDWQVEWLWPDGHVDHGPSVRRLWMSLDPMRVVVRLRNGARGIEGKRTLQVPRNLQAASVNKEPQIARYVKLLEKEDPMALPEPSRKAGFILARGFMPRAEAARWAEAWLALAKPDAGYWMNAISGAIQETSKTDPQAALARLDKLTPEGRKFLGRTADLLELDVRVFRLKDPMVVGLVSRLEKSGDKILARTATIRMGDYQLLNGRAGEAAQCYARASTGDAMQDARAPVIDRARSLAIEELLNDKHPDEALEKLNSWELERPMAKIEGDQLLWRARVMLLVDDCQRALQDIETALKVRAGSPEEIELRFWHGRALFGLGRKDEAREVWNSLVKDYPKHERAEAAKLWLAKQ